MFLLDRKLAVAAVIAACAATAAFLLAGGSTNADGAATAAADTVSAAPFSALRAPAPSASAPGEVRAAAARAPERFGLDASRARRAGTVAGRELWLLPGDDRICLGSTDPTGFVMTCDSAEEAQDGLGIAAAPVDATSEQRFSYIGVLPDGSHDLAVTTDGGSRRTVATEGGVYQVTTGEPASALEFEADDGRHRVALDG